MKAILTCDGVGNARKEVLLREFIGAGARYAASVVAPNAGGGGRGDGAAAIQDAMLKAFGLASARQEPRTDERRAF